MWIEKLDVCSQLRTLFLACLGIGASPFGHQERQNEGAVCKIDLALGKVFQIVGRNLAFRHLNVCNATIRSIFNKRCGRQRHRGATSCRMKCQVCLCQRDRRRQSDGRCGNGHFLKSPDHNILP